jgi:DNA-binding transcriptional MerR regulator
MELFRVISLPGKTVLAIMTALCYYRAMENKKYTIEELSELTGYTRRTIRYYVQEGLIDPPAGRGRGGFYYDSHIQQLLQIKSFQEKGIGITAMLSLMKKEVTDPVLPSREIMVRYQIVPGIEVNISREIEIKEPKKVLELIRVVKSIAKGDMTND